MAEIGHNSGQARLEAFEEACKRLASGEITDATAGAARDLIAEEVRIRKDLESAKAEEKRPHLDANAEIEGRYKPLLARAGDAIKGVKARLSAFLTAKEAAARAAADAAKRAAEEERRRAEEAAKQAAAEDDDPFAAFDAQEAARAAAAAQEAAKKAEPVRINVAGAETGAPAIGLRTSYDIEVTDAAALVAHYASNQIIIEEARKLAKTQIRMAKGADCNIPGIRVIEERKVA